MDSRYTGDRERQRQQRERRQKQGWGAGLLARLSKQLAKPPLPSIFLTNDISIANKIDELESVYSWLIMSRNPAPTNPWRYATARRLHDPPPWTNKTYVRARKEYLSAWRLVLRQQKNRQSLLTWPKTHVSWVEIILREAEENHICMRKDPSDSGEKVIIHSIKRDAEVVSEIILILSII